MPGPTIVLPFRQAARTIRQAVDSILAQTHSEFDLIAVDDGSTDDSLQSLAGITDKRLKVVENAHRPGVVGAFRTGLDLARGEWVVRMDADDLALPDRLERQLELTGNGVGVISGRVQVLESQGEGMDRYVAWANSLTTHSVIARSRFIECPVINPTAMVRRDWLERMGGYAETSWAEDHDLWLRLLHAGCRFAKSEATLIKWRDSAGRLTRTDPRYGTVQRSRMRAHHLAKLEAVRGHGVVVAGAGPIGKRLAQDLKREDIKVHAFLEVNPRRIGERIHGSEVVQPARLAQWPEQVLLGAVGVEGGREQIRQLAAEHGRREGSDFWCVC